VAKKVDASMPPKLDLSGGYSIEWDAVDPVSGATVAGVKVSDTSLLVAGSFGQADDGGAVLGPFRLVPGPSA
jgi:hypothetical protein